MAADTLNFQNTCTLPRFLVHRPMPRSGVQDADRAWGSVQGQGLDGAGGRLALHAAQPEAPLEDGGLGVLPGVEIPLKSSGAGLLSRHAGRQRGRLSALPATIPRMMTTPFGYRRPGGRQAGGFLHTALCSRFQCEDWHSLPQ